jgi:hypothetical protein
MADIPEDSMDALGSDRPKPLPRIRTVSRGSDTSNRAGSSRLKTPTLRNRTSTLSGRSNESVSYVCRALQVGQYYFFAAQRHPRSMRPSRAATIFTPQKLGDGWEPPSWALLPPLVPYLQKLVHSRRHFPAWASSVRRHPALLAGESAH